MQAQIREAKTLGLPILLVYETEKRYGAPLSEDKTFHFARVFGEQEYEALVRAAGGHHHGPGSPPSWLTVTRDFGQDSGRGDGGATLDRAGFRGLMTRMSRELGEDIDDLCRRLTRALEQQDR